MNIPSQFFFANTYFCRVLVLLPVLVFQFSGATAVASIPGTNSLSENGQPVEVSVDLKHPGEAVPADFVGLSFEASQLLPDTNGVHYFRPDNVALVNLFQTLGIKNLRIGGNTSDRDAKRLPDEGDLDSLFGFAKVANVKVIYCLRLHNGDVDEDVQTAKYIMENYASQMECFSIGQEPSAYPTEQRDTRAQDERMGAGKEKYKYEDYRVAWKTFADALIAAVPGIKFAGPSVHNNGQWAVDFVNDFGRTNHVILVTEHLYAGGAGGKVPSPEIGIDRMLAGEDSEMTNGFPKAYQKLYDSFVPMVLSNRLPYRLEEVNNYFNGGATNVSNTFASSLWGLDFMYWWASHSAGGLNFHTGDKVAAGASLQPSKYTAYYTAPDGFYVRPLGYGIKAFDMGGHGKFVPVTISNPSNLNVSVYGLVQGSTPFVTIINKEHGADGRDANITLNLNTNVFRYCEAMTLTAPNDDATAKAGVMLGGAPIEDDGSWKGKWSVMPQPVNGTVRVKVPACSAIILTFAPANYDESKVGTFTLPDPLASPSGAPVVDSDDWKDNQRPKILKQYEGYIYGSSPKWRNMIDKVWDANPHAFGDKAVRKQIDLEFYNYTPDKSGRPRGLTFHVLLYTPAAATNRVPVFLCLSFSPNFRDVDDPDVAVYPVWDRKTDKQEMPARIDRGTSHSWPVEKIIERGYGIALIDYNDIEPDLADGTGWKYGVRSLYMKPGETNFDADAWGAISAWAWGASRIVDYLESDPGVDASKIIMVGHSRLGKTALWAGAEDPRFAMVIASCSGEMGAALARRDYGETVTSMCKSFAYQFCPNFLDYSNAISDMPVDSHDLISLIAPRPLFLNTATEDRWSDPRGEWEAAIAAAPVYRLFGEQSVVTNLPPDAATNGMGSGSLMNSDVLESYKMPAPDTAVGNDVVFHEHTGKHDIYPGDWDFFLDFADRYFKAKDSSQ